jgi:hypothetical protein
VSTIGQDIRAVFKATVSRTIEKLALTGGRWRSRDDTRPESSFPQRS